MVNKKMRISLLYIFIVLAALISCSDNNDEENTHIAITQSDAVYDAAGGDGTITVNSLYGIKSVLSSDDWCAVSFGSDNTVSLSVAANPLEESRSAVVTITDNSGNETHLAISQQGSLYKLVDDKVFNFGYNDSTIVVNIAQKNINADLKASADWLTARQEGGNVVVHVAANNSGTWRAGTVYCQVAGASKDSIIVVQAKEKDIYGDYYMTGEPYYTQGIAYPTTTRVSIAKGDSTNLVKVTWTDTGFSCDYAFDTKSLVFKIWANMYHPLGYRRFVMDNMMVGGDIDEMSGVYLLMFYGNGEIQGGNRSNQNNLTTDAYLSAIGNQVVWRLRSNSSLPGVSFNGIFIYDDYESYFTSGGVFIQARDPYMIPVGR